jgi:dihydroxyacetone kinase-like protein
MSLEAISKTRGLGVYAWEAMLSVSREAVIRGIQMYADVIAENKEFLTRLDSAIGDADHGINMDRGFQSVLGRLANVADQDIGSIFKAVGMALVSSVGGASGPLYGTFFIQLGTATAGKMELTPEEWAVALQAGVNGVLMRGKASPGDKTMVDSLVPALEALKAALADGADFGEALRRSAGAAQGGMESTIPLVARKGRASYLGERSAGHQDPGATSSYLLLDTLAKAWTQGE